MLSPLLSVIALIPLNRILRIVNLGYKFRTGETKHHLLFMNDLKLYSKREKDLDSLMQNIRIFKKDIVMQLGIDKCAMLVVEKGENSKFR